MQNMNFVALDCETTGLTPENDHIIEVGAVKFNLDSDLASWDTLVNPGVRIPGLVARLTGITDTELSSAPKWSEKQAEFAEFCQDAILVGHNLAFDLAFLKNAGLDLTSQPSFDTFDLASLLLPRGGSLSLEVLAQRFGCVHSSAHRALSDAEATRDLLRVLLRLAGDFSPDKWQTILQLKTSDFSWIKRLAELALQGAGGRGQGAEISSETVDIAKKSSSFEPNTSAPSFTLFTAKAVTKTTELDQQFNCQLPTTNCQLLETTATPSELAASAPNSTLLAVQTLTQATELAQQLNYELPTKNCQLLLEPRHYLCQRKFAQLIQGDLTPPLAVLAAKILLHQKPLYELNCPWVEQLLVDFVAGSSKCLTHPECQFAQAWERTQASQLVVTQHASLPELVALPKREKNLLVTSALELPQSLINNRQITLDLNLLELLAPEHTTQLSLLWGMLGLLLQEAKPEWGKLELGTARHYRYYPEVIGTAMDLLAKVQDELPPKIASALTIFFDDTPGYSREIRNNAADEIKITLTPLLDPTELTQIQSHFETTTWADTALSTAPDDCDYARRVLHLPAETELNTLNKELVNLPELAVANELPSPSEARFQNELERWLISWLAKQTGIVTVVFPSRYTLGVFFEKAQSQLPQPILAEKNSGSRGKITKVLGEKESAVYCCTSTDWLPERTRQLVLVRLPFVVREGADWATETLPGAVLEWKKLWLLLAKANSTELKTLLCLDRRLSEKPYGKDFIKSIGVEITREV